MDLAASVFMHMAEPYILAHPMIVMSLVFFFTVVLPLFERWLGNTTFFKANSTLRLAEDFLGALKTAFFAAPWKESLAAIMGNKAPAGGLPGQAAVIEEPMEEAGK